MHTTRSPNAHITIEAGSSAESPLLFELQPIVCGNSIIPFGYEMLFRGTRKSAWLDIDRRVMRFLAEHAGTLPKLFVNLANESLLSIATDEFVRVAARHRVIFEVSELHSNAGVDEIAQKVNGLIERGLRFAIDDFGSGRDGLQRIYSLSEVSVVKIDGAFLINSMNRPDAAQVLHALVKQWQRNHILVVAESVESKEILQFVNCLGIDLAQGWHIDALVCKQPQAA